MCKWANRPRENIEKKILDQAIMSNNIVKKSLRIDRQMWQNIAF